MIKNAVMVLAIAFTFVLSIVAYPQAAYAQDVQDGTYNEAPGAGGTQGTTDDNQGFDWRWLLPLLAVPLLFLIPRGRKEDDRREYRTGQFAGTKGGEARRDRDDDVIVQ